MTYSIYNSPQGKMIKFRASFHWNDKGGVDLFCHVNRDMLLYHFLKFIETNNIFDYLAEGHPIVIHLTEAKTKHIIKCTWGSEQLLKLSDVTIATPCGSYKDGDNIYN